MGKSGTECDPALQVTNQPTAKLTRREALVLYCKAEWRFAVTLAILAGFPLPFLGLELFLPEAHYHAQADPAEWPWHISSAANIICLLIAIGLMKGMDYLLWPAKIAIHLAYIPLFAYYAAVTADSIWYKTEDFTDISRFLSTLEMTLIIFVLPYFSLLYLWSRVNRARKKWASL